MSQLLSDLADADATSVLGDLADSAADRTAEPILISAITRTIQVCGVNASDDDIADLAENIHEMGLVHPIEVCPNGDGTFTLTKGNGRLLAHVKLGRDTISAFVDSRPVTETSMAEYIRAQAAENAHRKQLSILEMLNTIEHLACPPCNSGRNAIGRIMKLPETTLKRYWRIFRTVRDRNPRWHPKVEAWLRTPQATWVQAAAFAADPAAQQRYVDSGELPHAAPNNDVHHDRADVTDRLAAPGGAEPSARLSRRVDHGSGNEAVRAGLSELHDSRTQPERPRRRRAADHIPPAPVGGPSGPPTTVPTSRPSVVTQQSVAEPSSAISAMWDRLRASLQDLAAHSPELPTPLRSEIRSALLTAATNLDA